MVWTRLFSRSQRADISEKTLAMDVASVMSTLIPTASGAPAFRSDSTAPSRAGLPLAITATLAPSAARVCAIASPMPLLPPVTTAVDPAKPRSIVAPPYSVARGDVRDRFGCHAQAAQAKTKSTLADLRTSAIACGPLPFSARPYHALNGLCFGHRVDVVEDMKNQPAVQLLDEWLEHLRVGGLNQLGRGEHLRLRLQRQPAQIGFDFLVEREV